MSINKKGINKLCSLHTMKYQSGTNTHTHNNMDKCQKHHSEQKKPDDKGNIIAYMKVKN